MSGEFGVPVIVAIGASAGGLKALERFFKSAPADIGVAFVVITHLDPRRDSMMVDLLANYSAMPVEVIRDGLAVGANHVYVIPPNSFVSIRNGILSLDTPIEGRGSRMAIDIFFRSLAAAEGQRAIGIVLSGTGTDGSLGVKAIKEAGGMVIAQEPQTAEHDGMPRSAIGTGLIDFVLDPAEMPAALRSYVEHKYVRGPEGAIGVPNDNETDDVDKALAIIHARTGRAFRHYKRGTIGRRMQRRMGLRQIQDLSQYVALLRKDESEAQLLVDDLLIGVTQFYRDARAFQQIESLVLTKLMERDPEIPLRIWVAGCSTGEEAYSIAISALESAAQAGRQPNMQIFATDIDERALATARTATYPESIAGDVAPDRLQRYFTKEEHRYTVNKNIRELVVFAQQDLIQDAPFSRLDLISCRNLLIYLESDVQHKVFSLLSFALNEGGYLFLGNSESVTLNEHLFATVDKQARIYRKVQAATFASRSPFPVVASTGARSRSGAGDEVRGKVRDRSAELIRNLLIDEIAPASVAVTADYKIVYAAGRVGEFLTFSSGEPTNDLLVVAKHGLRVKLRKIVRKALAANDVMIESAEISGNPARTVQIEARRIAHAKLEGSLCVVTFREIPKPASAGTGASDKAPGSDDPGEIEDAIVAQLEMELKTTREELQGTIEELESSNEELKTSNEEAMSMNEELQSTNEELETSKEELQSLNEEVSTVNTELQEKISLLENTNNDLNNLLASTDIATIFLDSNALVRRFTPSAQRVFMLIGSDIGRSIQDITHRLRGNINLAEEVRRASSKLQTIEDDVQDNDGNWYARRVAPYRTTDHRIDGAVATFADITKIKRAEASLKESEAQLRLLYDDNPSIYLTLDNRFVIRAVNRHGAEQLGMPTGELVGRSFVELYGQDEPVIGALRAALDGDGGSERWEARMSLQGGSEPWTRGVARRVLQGGEAALLVSLYDITNEKKLTDSVYFHSTHDYLTGLLNRREFDRILSRMCGSIHSDAVHHSLLYVDLANFKLINDTAGHAAGDEALRIVGDVLRRGATHVRQRDVIARLGGDEFALILEHCPVSESRRVAEQILANLRNATFEWEHHRFNLQCYIGIAPIIDPQVTAEEVLRTADAACYEAKVSGPGSIKTVDPSVTTLSQRRSDMEWARQIRTAIAERNIVLVCEPIVRGADDTVVAFELLLRLRDNPLAISTSSLIRAAERYGLGPDVDLHVIELALAQLSSNLGAIDWVEFFSINVSGQSLGSDDFCRDVERLVLSSSVPLSKLCFEVTETAAISNIRAAASFMQKMRGLGCKIALDDFGSGLSSFHYLKNLPCDMLKIDGPFVRDVAINESDRALVSAIHGIAKLFGVATVAEFVESPEINQVVKSIGIDLRQGHQFSQSGPMEQVLSREGLSSR